MSMEDWEERERVLFKTELIEKNFIFQNSMVRWRPWESVVRSVNWVTESALVQRPI